jgi:chemotaxis protein CheC
MSLSAFQFDTLKELINIGVGKAAGSLNEMVESHVILSVPEMRMISPDMLDTEMGNLDPSTMSAVTLGFMGDFSGSASLIFPLESAANLVSVLTGEEKGSPDLDAVKSATLTEVGNIVLNGVVGSLGNILNHNLDYTIPNYEEKPIKRMNIFQKTNSERVILLIKTQFSIMDFSIDGEIILIFELNSFNSLMEIMGIQIEK